MENDMIEKVVKEIDPKKKNWHKKETKTGKKTIQTVKEESKAKKEP